MARFKQERDGSLSVIAPAKVNLFLHVTGQRVNGFHELESLFAFTCSGDVLRISSSDKLYLNVTGPYADELSSLDDNHDNLVCKAALLLAKRIGIDPNVHIELEKNLPVASGIGGGSADAAAALLGLVEFWNLNITDTELADIALNLGADVPACLHTAPLYVRGIGEHILLRRLPKGYGILLVNPLEPVSTPAVFKTFAEQGSARFDLARGEDFLWPNENEAFIHFLETKTRNALQEPAESLSTSISDVLSALAEQKDSLYSSMSGSGATCFALFDSEAAADEVGRIIKKKFPNWWVKADSLISE
ncbi:MAG: 4-(cytidine 5'-diphospho)-2-C-methyl-D-erythritol kinase [Kordiimonas sp.]